MRMEIDYDRLAQRFGKSYLSARLCLQKHKASRVFSVGTKHLHIENIDWLPGAVGFVFRMLGLYRRAFEEFKNVRVNHNTFWLANLPAAFYGFTILHMSDLHIDLSPALTDVLIERLKGCKYDICVLTGDYRNKTTGSYEKVINQFEKLRPHIQKPVYAVLGNHDFIEMAQILEGLDIRVLVNEAVRITKDGASIGIAGIDDPNTYMLDNMQRAIEGLDVDSTRILLSHSSVVHRLAQAMDIDVLLCGHTHAGQICLPGGIAVMTNEHSPRYMLKGLWRYKTLQGYTSSGTGSCAQPLRLFCPPEMTLHRLFRA